MSRQPDPASVADLVTAVADQGHVLLRRGDTLAKLTRAIAPDDWAMFAASWADMPLDAYMADGGRYRRRRYGVFSITAGGDIQRQAHQPHWQSTDYNRLNGGVARWFEPVARDIGDSAAMRTLLGFCASVFCALAPTVARWHAEVHQFRIEAALGEAGQPTPEGIHRDGVDYVMVLLVRRENIASGTTTIHAPDGALLGSFTLTDPLDATLIDDHRVFHGVTPVVPVDARAPAYRDVLVVTFRRSIPV